MKEKFDSLDKQMSYISKLVTRNTDIEKKCQICGNPGLIRHNPENPYKIHIICRKCASKLNVRGVRGEALKKATGLDFIDVKSRINSKILNNKIVGLSKINKIHILTILNSNGITKRDAIKFTGLTINGYNSLIQKYKEEVDPNIEERLKKIYSEGRKRILLKAKSPKEPRPNNIELIKQRKHISNKDIINEANKKGITLFNSHISNISSGKYNPTIKTMFNIASILDSHIYEVFPNEWEHYHTIETYEEYVNLSDETRDLLNLYLADSKTLKPTLLKSISEKTDISLNTLNNFRYSYAKGTILSNKELYNLRKYLFERIDY